MTRWLTAGVAELCCGASLKAPHRQCLVSLAVSDDHTHGIQRRGDPEWICVAVAALARYPAHACLDEVVCCGHMAGRADQVQGSLEDEMSYLDRVPESNWQRLADLLGMVAWSRMRTNVLTFAHASCADLFNKTLETLHPYSWRPCWGMCGQS